MLDALSGIIENGGYLPPSTMKCISIGRMEMSEDGRDINVHYRLVRDSQPGSSRTAGFKEDIDMDSLFYDMSLLVIVDSSLEIENQRYVSRSYRQSRSPSMYELEVGIQRGREE